MVYEQSNKVNGYHRWQGTFIARKPAAPMTGHHHCFIFQVDHSGLFHPIYDAVLFVYEWRLFIDTAFNWFGKRGILAK